MKNIKFLIVILLSFVVLTTCKKDKTTTNTTIVPAAMSVYVPSSISAQNTNSSKSITPLKGNQIYQELRGFVWIGVGGTLVMHDLLDIVRALSTYNVTTLTFVSKSDGAKKSLAITQNATYNGSSYQYEMLVKDYDGSTALELFWNNTPAVTGVAVYNAYKINHYDFWGTIYRNAMVKIEYSEAIPAYSAQMIVTISNITPIIHTNDPDNIKLFVGKRKTDGLLDIYGNSNSPNAKIVDPTHTGGYQWAFVAHSDDTLDVSVAQVSLPPCTYGKSDSTLWGKYSLYNVLNGELSTTGWSPDTIANFLKNAKAPGYFVRGTGFVGCGTPAPTSPAGFTSTLCNLSGLFPYVPDSINNQAINFKKKK